jgi:hypothetical protein
MAATSISVKVGDQFGSLTIIAFGQGGRKSLECVCSCGVKRLYNACNLTSGNTRSCGCLNKEASSERAILRNTTHGHAKRGNLSRVFRIWSGMINRCHCEGEGALYQAYGAKGIRVCDRWRESFESFLKDMGEPPTVKHSIDRIDGTRGYSPENCRWATKLEQAQNRITTRNITFQGETLCISEWERKLGFRPSTLHRRLKCGWSIEKALTTPLTRENRREVYDQTKAKEEDG